jgi:hypothetical protein
MAVKGKGPGVDLLGVHKHGGTLSPVAPTEGISNERGTDSPSVNGWIYGETLEVTDRAGSAGDVIADDPVTECRHSEAGMGSGDSGIEKTYLIELPERIEGLTVNIENVGDIGVPSPTKVNALNSRSRNLAVLVTEEMKALVFDEPNVEKRRLFSRSHGRREHCGETA